MSVFYIYPIFIFISLAEHGSDGIVSVHCMVNSDWPVQ